MGFINLNATVKVEFEYFMELKEAAQIKRRKSTSQKRLLRLHLPLARELISLDDTKILSRSYIYHYLITILPLITDPRLKFIENSTKP